MNFPDLSSNLRIFSETLFDALLLGGVLFGLGFLNQRRRYRRIPVLAVRHERLRERINSAGAER